MRSILLIIQLVSALGLIATILLHSAKGEGLGGIGGSARLFGTQKGLEQGLDKITSFFAVAFVIISIILAVVNT